MALCVGEDSGSGGGGGARYYNSNLRIGKITACNISLLFNI